MYRPTRCLSTASHRKKCGIEVIRSIWYSSTYEINCLIEINEAGFRSYYDQPTEKHSHLIHHKLPPF